MRAVSRVGDRGEGSDSSLPGWAGHSSLSLLRVPERPGFFCIMGEGDGGVGGGKSRGADLRRPPATTPHKKPRLMDVPSCRGGFSLSHFLGALLSSSDGHLTTRPSSVRDHAGLNVRVRNRKICSFMT